MKSVRTTFVVLTLAALAASGCGIFKKGSAQDARPRRARCGSRGREDVAVDPATRRCPCLAPGAGANTEWAQSGGNAAKSMGHARTRPVPRQAWAVSHRPGGSLSQRLAAAPVVGDGRVYTIDTQATVRAFDAQTGATVWSTQFG